MRKKALGAKAVAFPRPDLRKAASILKPSSKAPPATTPPRKMDRRELLGPVKLVSQSLKGPAPLSESRP